MLNCLSDFTPLIQLLVGSVFISNITFRKIDPFEKERGKLIEQFLGRFQGLAQEYKYHTISKNTWRIGNNELMSSVMKILTVYGCIVLFYCAAFSKTQESPNIGLLLVSIFTCAYQIYAMYIYGKERIILHKIISNVTLGLLLLSFAIFIAIPLFIPIMNITINNELFIIIVNIFVMFNLVLWFGTYIKKYIISRGSKRYMMELNCNYSILNNIKPEEWMVEILNLYNEIEDAQEKEFLINAIACELGNDCNLYGIHTDAKSNVIHIDIDRSLPTNLQEKINTSTLPNQAKEQLCKPLKNKSIKSVQTIDYGVIRDKRLDKVEHSLKALCRSGIIAKDR